MDKINRLSLPATILFASVILGGFYYMGEISKQKAFQKQQETKLLEESKKDESLNVCFKDAEILKNNSIKYWVDFQEKTCVEGKAGGGSQTSRCLDMVLVEMGKAKTQEEKDRAECLKIYPQN